MESIPKVSWVKAAASHTVVIYAAFAALWILFSDQAVLLMTSDPRQIVLISTVKGWVFVAVTSLLLSFLLRRHLSRLAAFNDQLRESRERWKFALEGSGDGLWDFDESSKVLYLSPRLKAMVGYADDEIGTGIDEWLKRVHPDDMKQTVGAARALLSGDADGIINEHRICCKDGSWKWILGRGMVVRRGQDDRALRAVGTVTDITERKNAEEALRQSERRLLLAQEGANIGVWEWDMASGRSYWSPECERLYGLEPGSLKSNQEWRARIHPDDLPMIDAQWARINAGEPFEAEFRFRLDSGDTHWLLTKGVAQYDADGRPLSLSGINMDITERKEGESVRHALEVQLRESQKMEAIGTLAGGIAHDFNNILAAILGNAALANKDLDDSDLAAARVSLREIDKAGRRAKMLVQQILAFSRRQSQDFLAQPLRPLVEEALLLLRATLPAGVNIETALAEESVCAQVDATQIEQVVINLCTNAWHAVDGSNGCIQVALDELDVAPGMDIRPGNLTPGRYARIRVRDNGCGMDAETKARIFEPFYTTKPIDKGTGLGLAVVHGIVTSHQGAIAVDTTPGKGTTFDVYLPAAASAAPVERVAQTAPKPVAGQGRHVAYVDDDEAMVFLVTRMLEDRGYRVSGFGHGAQALAAIRDDPATFDLVVTDFNMPGLSGLEVAQEVHAIRPQLPVVITSGYITDELTAGAQAAGVREVVHKPDTVDALCDTIRSLLETAGTGT